MSLSVGNSAKFSFSPEGASAKDRTEVRLDSGDIIVYNGARLMHGIDEIIPNTCADPACWAVTAAEGSWCVFLILAGPRASGPRCRRRSTTASGCASACSGRLSCPPRQRLEPQRALALVLVLPLALLAVWVRLAVRPVALLAGCKRCRWHEVRTPTFFVVALAIGCSCTTPVAALRCVHTFATQRRKQQGECSRGHCRLHGS